MVDFLLVTKTIQLVLCFSFLASIDRLALADPPYNICSNTANYTANSPFANNLSNLLTSLSSNALISKFNYSSTGNEPDTVYGLYMCLDYVTDKSCQECIFLASQNIMRRCPNTKEAVVWEEVCQLRYSNENFFGRLDVSGNIGKDNVLDSSEPERFRYVVNNTLSNLTKHAAFDPSAKMYATGEKVFTDDDTLFALVQCTRDLSADECSTCLHTAIADVSSCCYFSIGARLLSRSCYLRYELYAFYKGETGPPVSASNKVTGKGMQRKLGMILILGIVSAVILVSLLAASVYCPLIKIRTRKKKRETIRQHVLLHDVEIQAANLQHQDFQESEGLKAQEFHIHLATIRKATDNFSDSNKLGQGGFGPVYKGILSDGKEVAVKRLSSCSEQGTVEFTNEVLLIMKLQHKNLVGLLGFCVDGGEKLLVYEFMPNSSLDIILFDPRKRAQLNWSTRLTIIKGIAKGILYLHEDSRLRIIHRDLKASNILLDYDMNPKISDFGMARIFAGSEGEANTATIVGTYGYMAPEYAMDGQYSIKSDVFSFGVLLLEIITGRRNAGFYKSKCGPSLLAYAWELWKEEREEELIDPLLNDSFCTDEYSRVFHIGLLCAQEDACDRPTMSSVVAMLKNETTTLSEPGKPAFSVGRFCDYDKANVNASSVNGLTISTVSPR